MPLDAKVQRLLTMILASRGGTEPETAEQRRAAFRSLMGLSKPEGDACSAQDLAMVGAAGPIPLRVYRSPRRSAGPAPGLIYLHGGGLVAGSLDTHDALCRTICAATGAVLIAVDYRLAPEHPFPAAIEDAIAATRWTFGESAALGIDAARIAIAGDSAGGTLAAATALALRVEDGPRLRAQILLCPLLDVLGESPSRRAFGRGFLLDAGLMARDLRDVLPEGGDLADPRLSPLRAPDVQGLPAAFIHTAEFDPLRDEGAAYAARLAAAGVVVRHTCHASLVHHFYGLAALVPAARDALHAITGEMRVALGG